MLTSSPTISAPSSPSAAFHSSTRSRSYHASRRTSTSASSTAQSPLFSVSSASASRRYDVPPSSRPIPIPSPTSAFTQSPQSRKRTYTDSGTQYTPPGYPPTYYPPEALALPSEPTATTPATTISTTTPSSSTSTSNSTSNIPRGDSSAAPVATEPAEPPLRVDPQPSDNAHPQPQTRSKSPTDGPRSVVGQEAVPRDASAVMQVPSSPAKRARPQGPSVKMMPLLYETCNIQDLGILISDMLMELVRINDEQPLRDGTLTRFHSRAPPGISVRDYLSRLIVHATLSPPILLSMVFYVDKLCAMYPSFTISSLTVHRFLITAATVAAKGLSDSFWTNSLYARVGGVSVRELALLELEFLRRLDWRIVPKPEVLVDYYKGLVERGSGFVLEKEPENITAIDADPTPPPTGSATGIQTNQSEP